MIVTETSSFDTTKPLRVAIIGAGIGGLTFALALAKVIPDEVVKIDVYEKTKEIKEIGGGIAFWQRSWEIFQRLGVSEALEQHLQKKPVAERSLVWAVTRGDQAKNIDMFEFYQNGSPAHFHRAEVHHTLMKVLPPSVKVHLSHRLVSYDESDDNVVLNFDSQEPQMCDLLIGADGIRSHVRAELINKRFPDEKKSINPIWGGTVLYRSLIDAEKVKKAFPDHVSLSKPMMYMGDGKYSVTFPIMHGRFINMAATVTNFSGDGTPFEGPSSETVTKEHILSLFGDWSEEYLGLLSNIDYCSKWTIQYLNILEKYATGRVALLGDAAHAMLPNLGAGAGQAVEDAYMLARLLLKALENDIPIHRVTDAYATTRRPIANLVLEKSREMARVGSFRAPGYEDISGADEETSRRLYEKLSVDVNEKFNWGEPYPVDKEVEKALEMLLLH
ncbi:hypothetical protein BDQ17DRAFT_1545816 [Cyathus striatus]|nr:hypothetical protein BDQ17DRAFT_1545816 [Cyathus striatus]